MIGFRSRNMPTLFTVGYAAWKPAERLRGLIAAFKNAGVTVLIDVRHSPCSAALSGDSIYGPKPWNLQVAGGIREALDAQGIRYVWMVELGNPQKNDPQMRILKAQLADEGADWPVHRGLRQLAALIGDNPVGCCILCACDKYDRCHRRLIAEAVRARHFGGALEIANVP